MKRIFKPAAVFLTALLNFNVLADEGEIYQADIKSKPQVLIILDTSRHMKKTTTYPFPERYDPHINYIDPPTGLVANTFYKAFTSEWFYHNNSSAAISTLPPHSELVRIAEKEYLELSEQEKYEQFVATIPGYYDSDTYLKFRYMNCQSALKDFYGDLGAYSDNIRQWIKVKVGEVLGFDKQRYKWEPIGSEGDLKWPYYFVDCESDIVNNIARNPGHEYEALFANKDDGDNLKKVSRQGFPNEDGETYRWNSYADTVLRHFEDREDDNTYLYSQNLVKWADLKAKGTKKLELSYLNVAKKVVLDLMLKTPEIQSGLEIFNMNNTNLEWIDLQNNHGGRIISGIKSLDPLDFDSDTDYQNAVSRLRNKVGEILTTSDSRSALCESLYEGYRYLYGKEVWYGDDQHLLNRPKRDMSVEKDWTNESQKKEGTYKSGVSFNACQNEAYIIVISAGYHDFDTYISCNNHDGEANGLIEKLAKELDLTDQEISDKQVSAYVDRRFFSDCSYKNAMPVLSYYLYNNDLNTLTDKKERIATYTIGLGPLATGSSELLEKAAKEGGGKFYNPIDAKSLRQTLQMAFADIIARQSSTTSSISTTISSSNSTQSDETVYYSMFEPNQTSRWKGNLKKFRIENGELSSWNEPASSEDDESFTSAISSATGTFFKASTYSGWSDDQDPNDVTKGGVNASYPKRKYDLDAQDDPEKHNPRVIYITSEDGKSLIPLSKTNVFDALGYALPVSSASDAVSTAESSVASLLGIGVEAIDDSIQWLEGLNSTGTGYRDDIFGDPMHSAPLVVKFPDQDDPRIFVGTNAGFFHTFKDSGRTVEEEWAFIPTHMLRRAIALRGVTNARQRIYGIDGSPIDVEYTDSKNNIKHLIAFGLRRGGDSYYGLNVDMVSGSSKPTLAWKISNDSADGNNATFAQLGQTWSTPVAGKVYRGIGSDDEPLQDNDKPVLIFGAGYDSAKDECGANAVSCDDELGRGVYVVDALDGSLIHGFTDSKMFKDSIASKVAVLDSNDDGYIDRIYAPDTGGNIYRFDMPYTRVKKAEVINRWTTMKLAELGTKEQAGDSPSKDDRRFFNPPSIVRASNSLGPHNDSFGSSYDGLIIGSGDVTKPNSDLNTQDYFFNIKDTYVNHAIWEDDYNGSPDVQVTKTPDPIKISDLTGGNNGWKFELAANNTASGEKSLGAGVVINGVVHFNSYSPFAGSSAPTVLENGQCVLDKTGDSYYYQLFLNTGIKTKIYRKLPNIIAKDLAVHAASDNGASVLRLLGAGKGDLDKTKKYTGTVDTEVKLIPKPVYLYFDEQKLANTYTSKNSDEAKL